jgi:hypothetical protein
MLSSVSRNGGDASSSDAIMGSTIFAASPVTLTGALATDRQQLCLQFPLVLYILGARDMFRRPYLRSVVASSVGPGLVQRVTPPSMLVAKT